MQQINPTASPRGQLGASQAKFHLEEPLGCVSVSMFWLRRAFKGKMQMCQYRHADALERVCGLHGVASTSVQ